MLSIIDPRLRLRFKPQGSKCTNKIHALRCIYCLQPFGFKEKIFPKIVSVKTCNYYV